MHSVQNVPVTVRATVRRPATELRPALKDVLAHLAASHAISLAVDIPDERRTPIEVALSVPGQVHIQDEADGILSLRISARGQHFRTFPSFWGVLRVDPSGGASSVATLRGTYTILPGVVMPGIDRNFLRRAAHSILRRFLETVIQETARLTSGVPADT